jgi:hypothetical protein
MGFVRAALARQAQAGTGASEKAQAGGAAA